MNNRSSRTEAGKGRGLEERFPSLHMPENGYVFLVTYGRSGSTLTQTILNSLPGYCIRGENENIAYYLCKAVYWLKTSENFTSRRFEATLPVEEQSSHLRDILGKSIDPWYGAELTDPDMFAYQVFDAFSAHILQIKEGTRVAGFKEIRFCDEPLFFEDYLTILQNFFPKSRFIFQTRNYEQVANSGWWRDVPIHEVKRVITEADDLFAGYARKNSNCHAIAYERYLSQPLAEVARLCDFLGEKFDVDKTRRILGEKLEHCQ